MVRGHVDRRRLALSCLGFVLGLSACPASTPPRVYPEVGSRVPELLGKDAEGRPFQLSTFERPARMLFFGYTSCPDVCPMTLLTIRKAIKDLGADPAKVGVVFVTVDPDRDDPATLKQYVEAFGVWVTPVRPNDLPKLISDFGLIVERAEVKGSTAAANLYTINHTATVVLLDRAGNVRARFAHGTPAEEIVPALRSLLGESS